MHAVRTQCKHLAIVSRMEPEVGGAVADLGGGGRLCSAIGALHALCANSSIFQNCLKVEVPLLVMLLLVAHRVLCTCYAFFS